MPPLTKPSIKQRKFAKLLVATGSTTKAALGAYNVGGRGGKNKNLANQTARVILKNPVVQELVRQELDKVGLNEGKIASKLNDIIDSGTDEKKMAFATPALALDAIKEVNKMKGNYAAEKKEVKTQSTKFTADLQGKSMDELLEAAKNLQKQMVEFKKIKATINTGTNKEVEDATVL